MPRLLSLDRSPIIAATIHPIHSFSVAYCVTFRHTSGVDPPFFQIANPAESNDSRVSSEI
jgi:hypothetical protein